MVGATYAFVLVEGSDWLKSTPDDWELEVIMLDGTEQKIGHRKIDGSICKILKNGDGKFIAITK